MNRAQFNAGAVLLLVGGLLETLQVALSDLISVPQPVAVRVLELSMPAITVDIGLAVLGLALVGTARVVLLAAAGLGLVDAINSAAQLVLGAPSGPGPAFLTGALSFCGLVVAAAIVAVNASQPRELRQALLLPVGGIVLFVLTVFLPLPPVVWFNVLPALGIALAGLVLTRRRFRPAATTRVA